MTRRRPGSERRGWGLSLVAVALCPASKLLVLVAGAGAVGGLAAGAMVFVVVAAVAGAAVYVWTRRHQCHHGTMIDPGGPVDPAVPPQPVDEVARPAAFTLMAPGWYPPDEAVTQSYGLCFTDGGLVVLVEADDGFWNLPGGQLEPGETARDALVREVAEEACARVVECRYLACQHVWDPEAPDGRTSHYQTRWWARVQLDPWEPRHETVQRLAVAPDRVLSTLSWQSIVIAERLLAAAVACDRQTATPPGG